MGFLKHHSLTAGKSLAWIYALSFLISNSLTSSTGLNLFQEENTLLDKQYYLGVAYDLGVRSTYWTIGIISRYKSSSKAGTSEYLEARYKVFQNMWPGSLEIEVSAKMDPNTLERIDLTTLNSGSNNDKHPSKFFGQLKDSYNLKYAEFNENGIEVLLRKNSMMQIENGLNVTMHSIKGYDRYEHSKQRRLIYLNVIQIIGLVVGIFLNFKNFRKTKFLVNEFLFYCMGIFYYFQMINSRLIEVGGSFLLNQIILFAFQLIYGCFLIFFIGEKIKAGKIVVDSIRLVSAVIWIGICMLNYSTSDSLEGSFFFVALLPVFHYVEESYSKSELLFNVAFVFGYKFMQLFSILQMMQQDLDEQSLMPPRKFVLKFGFLGTLILFGFAFAQVVFHPKLCLKVKKQQRFYIKKIKAREIPNKEDVNQNCIICLEIFDNEEEEVTITFCEHVFHTDCIKKWLDEKHECPVCKMECRPTENSGTNPRNRSLEEARNDNDNREIELP